MSMAIQVTRNATLEVEMSKITGTATKGGNWDGNWALSESTTWERENKSRMLEMAPKALLSIALYVKVEKYGLLVCDRSFLRSASVKCTDPQLKRP